MKMKRIEDLPEDYAAEKEAKDLIERGYVIDEIYCNPYGGCELKNEEDRGSCSEPCTKGKMRIGKTGDYFIVAEKEA